MKKTYLILFFLLLSNAVFASDNKPPQTSVFLTPEQTSAAENQARRNAPAGSADIYLGAVFYYGPDDWTLYLQGEKWTPQTRHDDLRVIDVSAEQVHIVWRDENGVEQTITLHPNQTYEMASKSIVP